MALQSEVSPPIVGESNKDHTQIDGDTKSDVESSQSTDEDIDLEEGEILDSGAEEEEGKDFTKSSLQDSLDQSCLRYIAEQISQAKNAKVIEPPGPSKPSPPQRIVKPYIDHDQREAASDNEDSWAPKSKTKYNEKTIDYRMELAAYRGTPPSSPDRKRRDDKPRRKSIKKVKKMKKLIRRKDAKGQRVLKYKKDAARGKICKFYKEGKCAKGADCPFSHPTPQKKKELCKFYLNGHCNKGNECHFMHNDFPCKFFHTGSECYAGKDCRFSHIPLTDEMQRVLADYLRMSHGDDIRLKERDDRGRIKERKRRFSHSPEPSPPEQKRVCLLGSPPRHIREAEETKRWQEEMKLQQQNHPGFEIHLENEEEIIFAKPNFYKDTLLNTPSPKKKHSKKDVRSYSHDSSNDEEEKLYVYDENNEIIEFDVPVTKVHEEYNSWEDKAPIVESAAVKIEEKSPPPPPQEPDFTNDIKFDETTQFSEMESFTDYPPALSPEQSSDTDEPLNQEDCKLEEKPLPPPSIIIPSHLPRRQQQLFMRVLQQQRKNDEAPGSPSGGDALEVPSSPPPKKEEVEEVKCEPAVQQENSWYSSEDDEEDSDEPLTDVLKKIQQAPPPKPQTKLKPKVNLLDMLNKIQQKSLDTNKSKGGVSKQQQGSFWKNLLGEDPKPKPLSIPTVPETNRRTLLPDPTVVKTEPPDPVLPKDPRLKNRDLRKQTIVPPKPNAVENLTTGQELGSDISKPTTVPPTELVTTNIPYKLRGIVTKPLNYTPYISASQSNPNLLKDPRLRKHMNPPVNDVSARNGKDPEVEKLIVQKDVPPMPDLLLNYKPTTSINIFESSTSTKPVVESSADVKPLSISDSSTSYLCSRRRESRCSSGSDTPPHLTIVDSGNSSPPQDSKTIPLLKNIWAPPVLEKSYSSPILTKVEAPMVKEEPLSPPSLQINEPMSPPTLKIKEPSLPPANGSTITDKGELKVIPTLQKIWTSTTKKEIETTAIKEECISPESEEVVVQKKSPSPPKEQFVTMFKKELPPMGSGDSHPVIPPLIIKKVKPTVASHLPRAIADPRMAKLHTPLDPRRPRVVASEKLSLKRTSPPKGEPSEPLQSDTMSKEHIKKPKEEKEKATKNIPKKRRLSDKSEERKRTVHRNRKSSMDYASPLNSYASNTNKELDYNNYNQRPKRSCNKTSQPSNSTPAKMPVADAPVVADFVLSDSSSLDCDNSSDINLKDKFKTIDPTASPFC